MVTVLDVGLEKVAELKELSNFMDIGRWMGVSYGLKFIGLREDAGLSELEAELGFFFTTKFAFC